MVVDPTSVVLTLVLLAVVGYALYWIIRKAVAHGIRDAREEMTRTVSRSRD